MIHNDKIESKTCFPLDGSSPLAVGDFVQT